jgi:hypothetical protein
LIAATGEEKGRFRAHIQRMEMHLTPADFERARKIIAARAPLVGETALTKRFC